MWVNSNPKVCSLLYLLLMEGWKTMKKAGRPRGSSFTRGAKQISALWARLHLTETCGCNGHGNVPGAQGCWWRSPLMRRWGSSEKALEKSHNNLTWCSQCLQPGCQRQGKATHSWTELPPEFIFKCIFTSVEFIFPFLALPFQAQIQFRETLPLSLDQALSLYCGWGFENCCYWNY